MNEWKNPSLVLSLIVLLAGCSSTPDKLDYQDSQITPTLEMPPNVIAPKSDRNLALPGSQVGLPSNTARSIDKRTLSNTDKRVLPQQLGDMRIQGQGDLFWLNVPVTAQALFPVLREFWLSEGFELSLDEPVMGILTTAWMPSKSGDKRSFFTAVLERMRAAESRHRYTSRIQRSADDASTLVFIAHRGQQLVIHDEDSTMTETGRQGWQLTPADPARETEMLYRLMVFLGMQDAEARAQIDNIGGFADRARVVQPNSTEDEEASPHLAVEQGFEQTWNRLLHQLSRRGITPADSGREQRSGYLAIEAKSFYKSLQQQESSIQRSVLIFTLQGHASADFTRIAVQDDKGSLDKSPQAYRILQSLLPLVN